MATRTKEPAEATRDQARRDDADQHTPTGSHDFPGPGQGSTKQSTDLGQQGIGQSDDVSGTAPASGMARQKANPARRG